MIRRLLFLAALYTFPFGFCQEKSLYWRDVTVNARLDADGKLHIEERQAMVFTGDWNGGERNFRKFLGQQLELERITRVDPGTGEEHELSRGDLSEVDQYKWYDSNTIRWRSHLPDDPPFNNTGITYVLYYTMSNILVPKDGRYVLDHDFIFPQRSGVIQSFTLNLTLDPVWEPLKEFEPPAGVGPIPPGQSYVVTIPLRYGGEGKPAAVHFGVAPPLRYAFLLVFLAAIFLLLILFYRREKSLGRFEPPAPVSSINDAWVETNILQLSPELAGAIWDESVGSAEVAAVLARLVVEGKLQSEVQGKKGSTVLHLKLIDRGGLAGYEKDLVDALFFDGGAETDTERVKKHYQSAGFDPASKIKAPLEKEMAKVLGPTTPGFRPLRIPTLILILAGLAMVAAGCLSGVYDLVTGLVGAAQIFALYIVSRIMAGFWRKRLVRQLPHFIYLMIPQALMVILLGLVLFSGFFRAGAWTLAGLMLLAAGAFNSILNAAKSRENAAQIAFRRRFAAAREYFRAQLSSPNPALRDSWYPYLLAFGLGESVDRWFNAYGRQATGVNSIGTSMSGSGSGGTSWTGGGGAFGGAGASASWAVAAGSMAAGVAAPGSSSGGGGGGSSGGGGGGGW